MLLPARLEGKRYSRFSSSLRKHPPDQVQCFGPYLKVVTLVNFDDLGPQNIFCLFHPDIIARLLGLSKGFFFLL